MGSTVSFGMYFCAVTVGKSTTEWRGEILLSVEISRLSLEWKKKCWVLSVMEGWGGAFCV